jgi:hypothetical protein
MTHDQAKHQFQAAGSCPNGGNVRRASCPGRPLTAFDPQSWPETCAVHPCRTSNSNSKRALSLGPDGNHDGSPGGAAPALGPQPLTRASRGPQPSFPAFLSYGNHPPWGASAQLTARTRTPTGGASSLRRTAHRKVRPGPGRRRPGIAGRGPPAAAHACAYPSRRSPEHFQDHHPGAVLPAVGRPGPGRQPGVGALADGAVQAGAGTRSRAMTPTIPSGEPGQERGSRLFDQPGGRPRHGSRSPRSSCGP